jgi:hypothetical protein
LELVKDLQKDADRELPSKAVDEALAIVRSASLTDIDWMKEPPSDGVRSAVAKQ